MEAEHILHIVPLYHDLANYIAAARAEPRADLAALWERLVLDPRWSEWAAGDFNEARTRRELSQPVPLADLDELEQEVRALEGAGVEQLVQTAYDRISAALPAPLPERAVCITALPPAQRHVLDQHNGVVGSCVGDNILLQIHPRGANWQQWLALVLAHEYHHTIAGYIHFYLKGNTSATLLNSLLFEGLADTFATSLFPGLRPAWIDALTPQQEAEQWRSIQPFLEDTGEDAYRRFLFGQPETGVPASTGYTLGYHIVQAYLSARPATRMADLVMLDAPDLLYLSGYGAKTHAEKP